MISRTSLHPSIPSSPTLPTALTTRLPRRLDPLSSRHFPPLISVYTLSAAALDPPSYHKATGHRQHHSVLEASELVHSSPMNGLSVKRSFSAVSGTDSSDHRPSKLVKRAPNSTDTVEGNWGSWLGNAVKSFKGLFSTPNPSRCL